MSRSDIERLITSQRYWLLQGQGVGVGHGGLRALVDLEVDERGRTSPTGRGIRCRSAELPISA